ncbi:MAG: beta-ketoacyl-ACP synthase [Gammaproteobacteria bacterium]|nr:beta-ketoacyl-ACP synthase [Gammaproteobacteria bacterium]
MSHRVVVTGMSSVSPLGEDWSDIFSHLKSCKNAIQHFPEWSEFEGLYTQLGAPAVFTDPGFSRKQMRGMGRVALLSVAATQRALADAGLLDDPAIQDGSMGVSYGSSAGAEAGLIDFGNMLVNKSTGTLNASSYIRMMAHTAPVNIGVFFKLKGRVITTSSACTSGSQGIGYAFEAIRDGKQRWMVAGGAEELSPSYAAVFDTLYAASTQNDSPETTPRPFDVNRDGLVTGEGAGTLILESLESAQARGAKIYAEIVGFATNSDGSHITQPNRETMQIAMEMALRDAKLDANQIDYINAHGTATDRGDVAESHATFNVFGSETPISSLKSYMGHTLGACGALEAIFSINMMHEKWFSPTVNLTEIDPDCAPLDYIRGEGRDIDATYIMSNNFAFGGINTSLIFKRYESA